MDTVFQILFCPVFRRPDSRVDPQFEAGFGQISIHLEVGLSSNDGIKIGEVNLRQFKVRSKSMSDREGIGSIAEDGLNGTILGAIAESTMDNQSILHINHGDE